MPDSSDPSQTTSRPKYHAVITYVPEEFIWCDWLHRQLDGTTVPADLANKRTRHGFPRPAVVQVFPDPRNPAHLARYATTPPPSRHLIVVCTPHSAGTAAIEEQIRAFKRTEGEDRIVVLVADGDPEHDDAPAGADDAAWLPAWLRWRLDKKGNFRPAEASEPQIIDARADKLSPPEARAHLLAALLDVSRDTLHAYDDLVSDHASETLEPAAHDEQDAAVVAAPAKSSSAGFIVMALIVAAAGGAYWWSTQSNQETSAVPVSTSSTPLVTAVASPTPEATPRPAATPTPKPATPAPSTPKPQPTITPRPAQATPKSSPASPATPAVVRQKAPAATPLPPKKVVPVFPTTTNAGSETAVTTIARPTASTKTQALPKEAGSSWQRMRDLGDTLMARENRDTGLIALTQATEVGLRTASAPGTTAEEQLDVARLCFRVGALQKQFVNPTEARRTLTGARKLLEGLRGSDAEQAECDSLVGDIDQLLRSIPR